MSTTTSAAPLTDAAIMLRRNFKHTLRNPVALFNSILMPLIMMLIFVYVFGDAFDVGVDYIDYAVPGMLMMTVSYGLSATSAAVSSDMAKGIINRFKVMDVSRGAVLTAHVVATMVRTLLALAVVLGVGLLLGFSPAATFPQWLGVVGVLVLTVFAVSWLTVALGLAAKTPESAGFATVPLIMLPFLSSAIVPADKMGPGIREFAEYQPFTPVIETVRGLFTGAPSAGSAIAAMAWCAGIAIVGYVWARVKFSKRA
ncbi:ABC transporter permease [Amycolatopsis granulosa]|uniref:ABC transporter permease n=1 Tax=Amycolatopsis granulosa TaxID=185684 RepID=UPI00142399C7|nr:ABC transporter permease [Amycolatopsis granulosa]NIH87122.1 ABC-2 type transport system permease protein [Amycolatopsis granulosa]